MQTWFENTISKRPLYSGSAYVFTARTDCMTGTVEFAVYNPLASPSKKCFTDFMKARDYHLGLGTNN